MLKSTSSLKVLSCLLVVVLVVVVVVVRCVGCCVGSSMYPLDSPLRFSNLIDLLSTPGESTPLTSNCSRAWKPLTDPLTSDLTGFVS